MSDHQKPPAMKLLFELTIQNNSNHTEVERIRRLTLNSNSSLGLGGLHGLYGTPEWWSSIQGGLIKTRKCSGIIYRVYFADGSDDSEDLMMDVYSNGLMVAESCYALSPADYHLFRPGHRVEFRCAYNELKVPREDGQPAYSQSMLEMLVSEKPWPGAELIVNNPEIGKIKRTFLLNP